MRCPTCNGPVESEAIPSFPFCSDRCRQVDLNRWLSESYGLPVVPDPDDDEEPEEFFPLHRENDEED